MQFPKSFPIPKLATPSRDSIAAISVGLIDSEIKLDLDYALDSAADVDMNVIMTGKGRFVELQGTGEEATFDEDQLQEMLRLAKLGIQGTAATSKRGDRFVRVQLE